MTGPSPVPVRIRFDAFEADLRTEELFRSGRRVRLPRQSFMVLAMLLERAGQLVTREELRARVWPAGTLVEYDQGLNAVVKRLREALGDSADKPRFIETLPKRGYRFIAETQPDLSQLLPSTSDLSNELAGNQHATELQLNDSAATAAARDGNGSAFTSGAREGAGGIRFSRKTFFAAAAGLSAILLVALTAWIFSDRSVTHAPSGRQIVPFTSLPGQEIAPTFSPDGSQIAFGWNGEAGAGHRFDLYVKSLGSERLLRLTHEPSVWITPAWSPDGSMIAFVREKREETGIFVVPALGGAERRIVSTAVAVGSFRQISWSPDGRSLAYSGYGPSGAAQVYIVAVDSLVTQPLSPAPECLDAAEPAFSPDGKQLALVCVSSSAVYSVHVVELPHGPMRQLATIMGNPQGLAWSADGRRLIFANDPGDGGELWQLTLNGQLAQLPFGENSSAPAVARDGRIAYVRGRKTINIWRADLTAANPEDSSVRLIYSTLTELMPRYSADGSRIAFQSNRSGSTEIWSTDAEGDNPDRMTSFDGPMTSSPSWCSDGRRIAFDSRVSGVSDIYVEDISERVPRKVVTPQANLSSPSWSKDCRWLFAHDGKNTLYRFAASGGRAEQVTEHRSSYSVVVEDRVIFNAMQPDGVVLWTKPVSGGTEQPVEQLQKLRYDDVWTATTAGIYFTDSSSRPVSVNFFEFESGTTRRLMTLQETPVPGSGPAIAVSPDGRWLLYTQVDDEHSEIMLALNP
ncbi:MAG TPA: winged helix-turn-helix domain-containing protein [Steroidobacter sp.]|uniref:winged helix-turn-helix domain-containing protein n=1 Tax=Steroidobacter sp. TaxID=1978227 RepID=UPI002ED921A1